VLTDLYTRRARVWAFANRDFATRYRASVLGWAWSLIQPLATLIVFAAVFTVVFRIQAPPLGNGNGSSYAAFLFTGLVTWNLFSSLLNLSMSQLKSNGELLKKVQFPAWTPILGASIVQLVQIVLELAVLIAMFLFLRNVGWTWILAVPILIGALLFSQGLGLRQP
jgi:ABC-2 type transport system permease protein